jgi:O-antigen/teichoic acid export membrane protein
MTLAADTMRTDLESNPRAMARGAAINLLGTFAANALGLVVTLVVTHMVSASAIGLVAIGTTVVGFASIVTIFGLDRGAVRFVALGASVGDERATRASLQFAIAASTVASVAIAAAIWWQAPWLADRFFEKPQAAEVIRLVGLSLPPLAIGRVVMSAVQGYGIMEYSAWLGIIRRILHFASVVPLLALGLEAKGLAISAVVTAAGATVASFIFLLRAHPRAFVPAVAAWPVLRMLNFSGPQVLTSALLFVMLWTSALLLARYGTATEVGIYTVIGTLLLPATLVAQAVGEMFAPRIAAEDARGDRDSLAKMLKRVTHWNTAISIPCFAALAVMPGPLLSLFGSTYRDGATALAILGMGQLLNTVAGPLGQVINMSGRQYLTATNNALVAAINLGAGLLLIPRYGMTGAAIATSVALTLVNLLKLVEVRVMFGFHPFREDSARTFAAAAIAGAVAAPASVLADGPAPLVEVLYVGSLLFAAYVAALWALGVSDEDRELFGLGRRKIARLGFPPGALRRAR